MKRKDLVRFSPDLLPNAVRDGDKLLCKTLASTWKPMITYGHRLPCVRIPWLVPEFGKP